MSTPQRLSGSDALLRLWVLAEVALAGLNAWLAQGVRDWPAEGPAPQPLSSVAIAEFMALFVIVPAAIVAASRWWQTRNRDLALLGLAYAAATVWLLVDGASADTAGAVRSVWWQRVGVAVIGVCTALRALHLR